MPRVLVVSDVFSPPQWGEPCRTHRFVSQLSHFGWEPQVLCLQQRPASSDTNHVVVHESLPWAKFQRVIFRGVSAFSAKSGSDDQSAAKPAAWYRGDSVEHFFLARKGLNLAKRHRFDLVYAAGQTPGIHLAAQWLARRIQCPWVSDLSPACALLNEAAEKAQKLYRWKNDILENQVLATSQRVLVHTQEFRNFLLQRFPKVPRAHVQVVPDCFEAVDVVEASQDRTARPFHLFVHQNDWHYQSIKNFLGALEKIFKKHPGWISEFLFYWYGHRPREIETVLQRLNLMQSFQFLNEKPVSRAQEAAAASHVFVILQDEHHSQSVLDSYPLFQWIGYGKPILGVGPKGAVRRLIRELKLGRDFSSAEMEGIAATLTYWFVEFKNNALPMRNRRFSSYEPFEVTRQLASVFDFCLQRYETP